MMKKFKWSYDQEDDVLFIFESNRKSKESIEIEEDIVIDLDKDNNLVGMQIFYAYELFKAVDKNFPKKALTEVKDVNVDFSTYRNYVIIKLLIPFNKTILEEKLPPIPIRKYESPILRYV